jgi:type IV pilus assembly protein PilM
MGLFSKEITGIDIGSGSIKVVRIARSGRRHKLLFAGLVEFSLDPSKSVDAGADLKYLMSGNRVGKKDAVITHMPGKYLTIRCLTLPKMPKAELAEAVRWESKRHISYPLDAALVEYLVLGEKKEGTLEKYEVLMVAVERGAVIEQLLPFRDAGVTVSAVDANPLALRNVFRNREQPHELNTLIADIGAGKTEINIFKGSALRFSRCLETGGNDIVRTLSDQLQIGLPEAEQAMRKVDLLAPPGGDKVAAAVRGKFDSMLAEVRRSIEYYKASFREKGVERTILTGGLSLMTGIKDYFSVALEGSVELDKPFMNVSCRKNVLEEYGQIAPRFSTAVGLALRKI